MCTAARFNPAHLCTPLENSPPIQVNFPQVLLKFSSNRHRPWNPAQTILSRHPVQLDKPVCLPHPSVNDSSCCRGDYTSNGPPTCIHRITTPLADKYSSTVWNDQKYASLSLCLRSRGSHSITLGLFCRQWRRWPMDFGELHSLGSRRWERFMVSSSLAWLIARRYRNESALCLHRVFTAWLISLMTGYFLAQSDRLRRTSSVLPVVLCGLSR